MYARRQRPIPSLNNQKILVVFSTSVVKSTTRKRETVRSFIAVVDQNGMVYIRRGTLFHTTIHPFSSTLI
jgi:hypothetical protein